MINYTNIGIESNNKSMGSGLITAMQILMNNTPNTREAIVHAKTTYENINAKLGKSDNKVRVISDSRQQEEDMDI